jgi:hypothetical protein
MKTAFYAAGKLVIAVNSERHISPFRDSFRDLKTPVFLSRLKTTFPHPATDTTGKN